MDSNKIAEAINTLAYAVNNVAQAIRELGTGDTFTNGMGAIEFLGLKVGEIADAINNKD